MRRLRFFLTTVMTAVFALSSVAGADDSAITNKDMSRTIKVPLFEQDLVNEALPEAEHAFTDMMEFYVPAQAASGAPAGETETGLITYCNIDNQITGGDTADETGAPADCVDYVEQLPVAKPLVNVFLFGPQFEVPHTAFAHRWFDTYAAVSLDDGLTWKKTNLSKSAEQSSFNIEEDHKPSNKDPLPSDHNIVLGDAFQIAHAKGYDTPYTAHCAECHGQGLQGIAEVPSCYSCHDAVWSEESPAEIGPTITHAIWDPESKTKGYLKIEGVNAVYKVKVKIINAITGGEVAIVKAEFDGSFAVEEKFKTESQPCVVAAEYTDNNGDVFVGPSLSVTDPVTHEPIENCEGTPINLNDYPGGSYNVFQATVGNKTLVAWPSRYCEQGQAAYTLTTVNDNEEADNDGRTDEEKAAQLTAITDLIRDGKDELGLIGLSGFTSTVSETVDDLYLVDAFGVKGSQGSVDFAEEGYPQAGIVPYGCVWTSRGVLLPGDDPRTGTDTEPVVESSHMVWTKAERLTSGRRDVNRIEVHGVKGAGFVITWQEDPEGLRPGQGLGPGEGWSGAVAHSQTDAWYSFINEEYFDIVEDPTVTDDPDDDVITISPPIRIQNASLDKDLEEGGTGRPKVFVPMAVPMRLSNNAKCKPEDTTVTDDPDTSGTGIPAIYCDYDGIVDVQIGASAFGLKNQCADTVIVTTGPAEKPDQQVDKEICVVDSDGDGVADLPNRANTSLTRPRTSLQSYNVTDTDKSAWVIMAAEESKGLGKYFFEPSTDGLYAIPCTADEAEVEGSYCIEEIGKNQWYFSFDMGTPDTSAGIDNPNSLVNNLVSQGNMLNQGEVHWTTGEMFGLMTTLDMEDYGVYNFDILNTEIARRSSLLVQGVGSAMASANGLAAISSWKQGNMRQGGPADTMLRRFVLPAIFDAAVDNPYAFENMECETFLIAAGENPYYPGGVCADPAINLSGVVPDTCNDDGGEGDNNPIPCPTVDFTGTSTYGIGDTNPILRGFIQGEGNTQRVLTWHQCPSDGVVIAADGTPVTCATDTVRTDDFVNLRDQSWYNPLDVSKGHRGFLDGDFVMFLYGWSPTWRLNAKGNDRYDLYVRRSFDGGLTWTTTPASFAANDGETYSGDGTVTCESYRPVPADTVSGARVEPTACYSFAAGAAEHARNVTQHRSMNITTLDPRMAKAGGPRGVSIGVGCTDGFFAVVPDDMAVGVDGTVFTCDDLSVDYDSDLRDPSRYFMVFEVGDNSTVEEGEAEPLDLFYSRAESFGDHYVVWTETDSDTALTVGTDTVCYPSDPHGDDFVIYPVIGSGFCNEFDNMNTGGDTHSSEANLVANPNASKLYGVWSQWVFAYDDDYESEIVESAAMARRIWWIDDYVGDDLLTYTLPGTQKPEE